MLLMNLLDNFLILEQFRLQLLVSNLQQVMHFLFDLKGCVVFFFLVQCLCQDCLFSRELHLDLFLLYMLDLLNLVFLNHLTLPAGEIRSVLEPHRHLCELSFLILLLAIN